MRISEPRFRAYLTRSPKLKTLNLISNRLIRNDPLLSDGEDLLAVLIAIFDRSKTSHFFENRTE